mgnify:CR=1 FL=1
MNGHEFIEARYIDKNHTNVMTLWKSPEGEFREEVVQADPTQNQWLNLMKYTDEDAILDRTAEWKREEAQKMNQMTFNIHKDYIMEQINIGVQLKFNDMKADMDAKVAEITAKLESKIKEVETVRKDIENKTEDYDAMQSAFEEDIKSLNIVNNTLRKEVNQAWEQAKDKWKKDEVIAQLHETLERRNLSLKHMESDVEKIKLSDGMPEVDVILDSLVEKNDNQELLFKLKLAVFEKENIKKSKDRKLKTDIRKSKTLFELFNIVKDVI